MYVQIINQYNACFAHLCKYPINWKLTLHISANIKLAKNKLCTFEQLANHCEMHFAHLCKQYFILN